MRNIRLKLLISAVSILLAYSSNGQGCSDAGFCTLNSFKPNNKDSADEFTNQIKLGISYGSADNSVSTIGNYLEYHRKLNENISFDAKITSLAQNGNGISAFSLSDIYLNSNLKSGKNIMLTAGIKIPFTSGNHQKNNFPLPMDYQSSLGTVDVLIGVGYEIKRIQLVAAIQYPLTQNKNAFISDNYPPTSILHEFQSTNNYKRSGDILLRISYPILLGKTIKLTPAILPIYHLENDKYTDVSGVEKSISGSQGLTLNGNLYFDYEINSRNILQLSIAKPFIVRDARPDGLTRSFIASFEYRVKF